MNKKLIITRESLYGHPSIVTAMEEDGRIVQIQLQPEQEHGILGNIYIGKVQKVVTNIGAAFIDIAPGSTCYYALSENPNPHFTSLKKDNVLRAGDELLVQIHSEAVKSKAPTVTSTLNIPGKYLVLTTDQKGIGLSSKLSKEEKTRLKEWMTPYMREDCGVIVRTNAKDVDKEQIFQELCVLFERLDQIFQKGMSRSCYSLIDSAPSEFITILRSISSAQLGEIITDVPGIHKTILEYLTHAQPEDVGKLRLYQDDLLSLYHLYSLETVLSRAVSEKVWLSSGGFLIIQQTEAFVVIDVNTGKYQGKKKTSETYRKVNLEAAREIAIQLRLRNLSGIILIDFINMTDKEHQQELYHVLQKHLGRDSIKATVVDITPLHIMEMTRQKIKKTLSQQIQEIKNM